MFSGMGHALLRRLQQTRPLGDAAAEATVNLLLAAAWLGDRLDQALAPFGLSHPQYNVLRILKGVHPQGHPRCDIAARMIDRAPDVTRILDRLETRGLVERTRCPEDGRRSIARITRKGLALVDEGTRALEPVQRALGHRVHAKDLSDACEALYGPDF
jgi:DNA-binding MarR family transcriptional regulator